MCVFLGQSELVGLLSEYFTIESPSSKETHNVYLYGIGLSLLACSTVLLSILFYVGEKIGGIIRILLTSTIYQKVSTILVLLWYTGHCYLTVDKDSYISLKC